MEVALASLGIAAMLDRHQNSFANGEFLLFEMLVYPQ